MIANHVARQTMACFKSKSINFSSILKHQSKFLLFILVFLQFLSSRHFLFLLRCATIWQPPPKPSSAPFSSGEGSLEPFSPPTTRTSQRRSCSLRVCLERAAWSHDNASLTQLSDHPADRSTFPQPHFISPHPRLPRSALVKAMTASAKLVAQLAKIAVVRHRQASTEPPSTGATTLELTLS